MDIIASGMLSKKGRPQIIIDGYKFRLKQKSKDGWCMWCCVNKTCPGNIYTRGEAADNIDFNKSNLTHDHDNDYNLNRQVMYYRLKRKLREDDTLLHERPVKKCLRKIYEEGEDNSDLKSADISRIRRNVYDEKEHLQEAEDNALKNRKDDMFVLGTNYLLIDSEARRQPKKERPSPPSSSSEASDREHDKSVKQLFINHASNASQESFENHEPYVNQESFVSGESTAYPTSTIHITPKRKLEDETDKIYKLISERLATSRPQDKLDHFGKSWAASLRSVPEQQQIFAIRMINDVIYEALMGSLSRDHRLGIMKQL